MDLGIVSRENAKIPKTGTGGVKIIHFMVHLIPGQKHIQLEIE